MSDFVILKVFNTRIEAQLVKGFLESQNIKALIFSDDEGGMAPYPMQISSTGVQLLVKGNDYKKADNLLRKKVS